MKRTIWTRAYIPFRVGGNVRPNIKTEVDATSEKIVSGVNFFAFLTPKGSLRICEAISGGIVADSFEQLERDMADADPCIIKAQLEEAVKLVESAESMTNDEFFRLYKY